MNPQHAWAPYTPSAARPWDVRAVGHLFRRAAFGASFADLEQGLRDGPAATIDKLLQGGTDPEFDRTSEFMASIRSLPAGAAGVSLAAWWLYRLLRSPHPLREKLTLFWHNHFATSHAKVQNARFMLGQYRTLHAHALGSFKDMVHAVTLDPAMLVWLDGTANKKGKPNENYARELMELFALGIGHYTEADIREAARALTGYDVKNGTGTFDPKEHDPGTKKVFGKAGPFQGADVVNLCLDRPECGRFLVGKLYRQFISETDPPPPELLEPLAVRYRKSNYDTADLVGVMLRSNQFFSSAAYRQRVKSPVDFAVGLVRALEGDVGPLPLATALEGLGQVLFAPPSVKGWDGGPAWLNGQTLLFRQNLALALTSTEDIRFGRRCDPVAALARHNKKSDAEAVEFFLTVFLQQDVPADARRRLGEHLAKSRATTYPPFWSADDVAGHRLRAVAHLTLTLPEYQLD